MKDYKKITPFFTDHRGEMSYIIDGEAEINSILFITCNKGAIRANHYHKKSSHYSYLIKGSMEYSWYDVGVTLPVSRQEGKKIKKIIVKAGDLIFTPPMVAHAMRFLEDSSFLTFDTKQRGKGKYEGDLIRVKVI